MLSFMKVIPWYHDVKTSEFDIENRFNIGCDLSLF